MLSYVGDVNGNRLLLLDLRGEEHVSSTDLAEVSEKLCATGLIDDLLAIQHSEEACASLRVIGADRREADFCGDGFLFVLNVLSDQMRRTGRQETTLSIETLHGIKYGARSEEGYVSAMIGAVEIRDAELTAAAQQAIEAFGVIYEGYRIAGEPHLVVSSPIGSDLQNLDQVQFEQLARQLASLIKHEGGVNVTMILSSASQYAKIRTFERGVKRMTQACGSGAVAAASLVFERDRSKTDFKIESPGGLHLVSTDPHGKNWQLAAAEINVAATQDFEIDVFDPKRDIQRLLQFILA
ncbi:diaminopimelate epimerase [Arenibacterium sp. CAU 1754]